MLPDPMSADATEHSINVIPIDFRKDFKPDRNKKGEFREIHMVTLVKKGQPGSDTPWNIKELKQNSILWRHIEPHYDAWVKGQDEPDNGTPLDVLSFLVPAQVKHLRDLHIRTAEDLGAINDADMGRIGMGARMMREKCRAYLETKANYSVVAEANAELTARVEQQDTEIAEMRATLDTLTAGKPKRQKPADMAK